MIKLVKNSYSLFNLELKIKRSSEIRLKMSKLGHFLFDRTLILSYAKTTLCVQNTKSLQGKMTPRFYVFIGKLLSLFSNLQ